MNEFPMAFDKMQQWWNESLGWTFRVDAVLGGAFC